MSSRIYIIISVLVFSVCLILKAHPRDINDATRSPDKLPTSKVRERKSFTELLIKSGSDKYSRHHYERYYEKWLAPYREKTGLKFLEIGANEGHSLNLWADYFDRDPEIIVGLAYGGGETIVRAGTFVTEADKPKITVIEGDQSSSDTISKLSEIGPWDVIIDDGSHVPQHVLLTLFSLWVNIKEGGMYIIEDIETSYWKSGSKIYGYKLDGTGFVSDSEHSAVYKLKEVIDVLSRNQLGLDSSTISVLPGDDSICSIEWGQNIVALKKCSREDAYQVPPLSKRKWYSTGNFEQWKENVIKTNPK